MSEIETDYHLPIQGVLADPELRQFGVGLSDHFDRLLTIDNVREATSLSKSQIYKRIAASTFPAGYHVFGTRRRVWKESDIAAWIDANLVPPG